MKKNLNINDTIAFIAPSGAYGEFEKLNAACDFLIAKGYKVEIFPTCTKNWHGFAGNEDERIKDLHNAFLNPEIKAIICARGGFGALKLLDKIDYEIIKNNPKIFAGSSDITLLLLSFLTNSNLITYHSQMGLNLCCDEVFEDFLNVVNGEKCTIMPKNNHKTLQKGSAEGILWGGNLATIVSLFGANEATYLPNKDIILFLEDINEPAYKIDRMLTQILRHKNLKEKIKGIVFGEFMETNEVELEFILKEFTKKLNVCAHYGYNISHCTNNITLPVGKNIQLKCNGKLSYI